MDYPDRCAFDFLQGLTLINIEVRGGTQITFTSNSGQQFKLFHPQDSWEEVAIEHIEGDLDDLLNLPLIEARETTHAEQQLWALINSLPEKEDEIDESRAYYHLATAKGRVIILWYGTSSDCGSEIVHFERFS